MNSVRLDRRLDELEHEYDGRFSVCVVDLESDERFERDAQAARETASTFKLCVLCELFRQAEVGAVDLEASAAWSDRHWRGGGGVLRAMQPGELSVHNLATIMITVSDNVATSVMVELVGAANVTRTMHEWGLANTDIFADLPSGPRAEGMQEPVSTARDMCSLITRIYRRELLRPDSCDEIIRILRAQRCNDMLPRYIPVGEDWGNATTWIANKTGYGRCRVDVGVVKTDDVTFAMAMFFEPNASVSNALKCLADYPPVLAMACACRAVYECVADR